MGQKELLIETQGNWGDIRTGDSAAAPRYIEARLTKFALDVAFNPQTTQWQVSYDGRRNEPHRLHLDGAAPRVLLRGGQATLDDGVASLAPLAGGRELIGVGGEQRGQRRGIATLAGIERFWVQVSIPVAHLRQLLAGHEVQMPTYDFKLGRRIETTRPLRLGSDEILLLDTLHGLYDPLTASVDDSACESPSEYAADWGFSSALSTMVMFCGAVDAKASGSRPPYGSG